MMENVVIQDPKKLEKIKRSISKAGVKKLHVIADFDKTLTRAFVNGEKRPSLISILRDGEYLTPDYAAKAHALYDKYYPIEADPKISLLEKKKAMRTWWQTHFALLIKLGLNKKDLEKVVVSEKIEFREDALDFFDTLHSHKIPLIILSATGLGKETISLFFKKRGKMYDNIYIISNSFEWDEKGNMIGVKQPIVHSMNKDETVVKDFPEAFKMVEDRKNVLLLGDILGDIAMIDGFDYDNLIKIGFLNENIDQDLKYFKNDYDIVLLNDSSMKPINNLLKEIIDK